MQPFPWSRSEEVVNLSGYELLDMKHPRTSNNQMLIKRRLWRFTENISGSADGGEIDVVENIQIHKSESHLVTEDFIIYKDRT